MRYAGAKKLVVSLSTVFAVFGPPMIVITSVDLIGGYIQDDLTLKLEFLKTAGMLAVWWICAIMTAANSRSPATASSLLLSAAAATAIHVVSTLVGIFVFVGLFSILATCLILTLPTLALAIMNARLVKRLDGLR